MCSCSTSALVTRSRALCERRSPTAHRPPHWCGTASRDYDPKISALGTGNDLVKWLNAELEHLLVTNWNEANHPLDPHDATFGALFERTGIELVIVAVDSVSSRHCIFSHSTTPSCSVADAAIASSSIPFVLRPRRLELATNDADATRYVYPIVDGGVWTNFPKFVFDDAQFRRYHGLGEQPDLTVVGFLLDEVSAADYRMTMTPTARFVDQSELEPKRRPRVLPAEALLSWKAAEIEKCLKARDTRRGRIVQEFSETALVKALQTPETIPGFRITAPRQDVAGQDIRYQTAATQDSAGQQHDDGAGFPPSARCGLLVVAAGLGGHRRRPRVRCIHLV